MTPSTHLLAIGRPLLLAAIIALGIVTGTQATEATCSDTAERYPVLIGSIYEGTPCPPADVACSDTVVRYPMLIGSGYEGTPCDATVAGTPSGAAATPGPDWHATMLAGSIYDVAAIGAAASSSGRP